MNSTLPIAIETYLKQSDFSASEMLLLRKLLEEDALTLRELASKTGKSTGVLDIAMKKLLRKGIAKRTVINGTLRYCIESLDAVASWVKHDMEEKRRDLERRHQSFESFIASLKVDKKRPDMEYFQGLEGMQQAYLKLLEPGKEIITLTPVLYRAEDDPLRAFRVEYFKRRQARKIFQRVIAPDTPLSRRYQSRDPFEYRRTALLPSKEFPIGFERTVVGDTVACFNFQEETACFLKYPEHANAEHATFEHLWAHAIARERGESQPLETFLPKAESGVPLGTRVMSRARQFFLSQKSMVMLAVFSLLAAAISLGLSGNAQSINLARLQEKLKTVASIGAMHFDPKDIEEIRIADDIRKPAYARLVATLNLIRRSDPDIRFTYIMRETDDPTKLAFVADADSLNPSAIIDLDKSGSIGPEDELAYPGDPYDIADAMYMHEGFVRPIVDPEPRTDQWGTLFAGTAPIFNDSGESIAILGVDMLSQRLNELTPSVASIFFAFFTIFALIVIVRFGFANRSLMAELWAVIAKHIRLIVLVFAFVTLSAVALVTLYKWHMRNILIEETGKRLMAIAVTAAGEFDPADLDQLHWARDMKKPAYQRVFRKLNEIRNKNPEIKFAYIIRVTEEPHLYVFVGDADTNWNLPYVAQTSIYDFSDLNEADENVPPGVSYFNETSAFFRAKIRPTYEAYRDQWGYLVDGLATIVTNEYILGLGVGLSGQ